MSWPAASAQQGRLAGGKAKLPACGRQNGQCLAACCSPLLDEVAGAFLPAAAAAVVVLAVLQISAQEAVLPLATTKAEAMEGTSALSKIAKQAIQTVMSLFFQKRFMARIIAR